MVEYFHDFHESHAQTEVMKIDPQVQGLTLQNHEIMMNHENKQRS